MFLTKTFYPASEADPVHFSSGILLLKLVSVQVLSCRSVSCDPATASAVILQAKRILFIFSGEL